MLGKDFASALKAKAKSTHHSSTDMTDENASIDSAKKKRF